MSSAKGYAKNVRWSILGALLLIPALLIKPVQDRVEAYAGSAAPDPDLLYFRSPPAIRSMALGYESLLADAYWVRAIQYYGRRDEAGKRAVRYKNLATLLNIVTTLDPDMIEVYRAGTVFLSEPEPIGAGRPEDALQLLDKGIARHPGEWRLSFDKGFVWFTYLDQPEKAGQVWLAASRLPEAPDWMEGLAAMAFSKDGAIETARAIWQRQYREATRADVRENARNRLMSLQVAEDLWTLEFLVEKYSAAKGGLPCDLRDLVTAGFLRAAPADPTGVPYAYDQSTGAVHLSPDSTVSLFPLSSKYREAFREKLESMKDYLAVVTRSRPSSLLR